MSVGFKKSLADTEHQQANIAQPIISFQNISFNYFDGPAILNNISFDYSYGSYHYITGPSGSGKTSLLRMLYLDLNPSSGNYTLFTKKVDKLSRSQRAKLKRKIGVVFQDFQLIPHLNVFDNLALPLRLRGEENEKIENYVNEILRWIELENWRESFPNTLSGGQQQLIAVARAVIFQPTLLIADEPTGNIDSRAAARVMHLFEELNKLGMTIIIATHAQQLIKRFSHPCYDLRNLQKASA